MVIYGLYVFDRKCNCTFYHSYAGKTPRTSPTTLPNVYRPSSTSPPAPLPAVVPPWDRARGNPPVEEQGPTGLPFDEEAKLVYGIIFSLRNMVKKLAGQDEDSFHSFSTSAYKLHYLHTATSNHFVLITSPMSESLRFVLRQIYTGAFTEFVVRNPMIEMDSSISGRGIDNDAFRAAIEAIVVGL